ncbi:MAG: aminotransferase class I/II-fold pyridoxal phosphate-dependent enzyme [Chitinophagaceae bacterium]|nr:aminotransferase class I/II-fold pyridoxal phosphate-dependent enzyme [Chitinophagaceae bacterium]
MTSLNRRLFLKRSGIGLLPAFVPLSSLAADANKNKSAPPAAPIIKFFGDGEVYEPGDYLLELQKINSSNSITRDRYGAGGAVEALEKKMAEITGKEKAIFMPTGTMANQLALAVLSGENTKVFVQDTSHVYRDEADAAQSVFQKRLMPLAKGATFFTADQLQSAIENLKEEEVFKSGVGAVSIENPVRRTDERHVPLEEIKKISAWCRNNNIRLHLDGARIFIASGWTGVSVKEYASYFDTVYISLYKYFGASGGAVLCGPASVIDKMPHLVKIHGGTMYGNWANAAMALNRMEGFESRLKNAIAASVELFNELNKIPGIHISPLEGGTNTYSMVISKEIDMRKMNESLTKEFNIRIPRPDEKNQMLIAVNETILYQSTAYIVNAFTKSIK